MIEGDVHIAIRSGVDIVTARQAGRQLAAQAGFSECDVTVIATVISELARNIVEFAGSGEIILGLIEDAKKKGFCVEARDHGPGIPDIELVMQEGYSTGGGLGLGLPGTRRLMDDLQITSGVGEATSVVATKWIPR
jgi:serine/threonine-protein kinase RsbT